MEYLIRQYGLEQGALEIEYIEEFFGEFARRKTSNEITGRLTEREHLIVMAVAALPGDPGTLMPVSYKVCHELFSQESDPRLADLAAQIEDVVDFNGRRVLYSWIGGTRIDWRGQGHFRALTEEQEAWAIAAGFDEVVVKTKNRYYEMRGTLANLHFNVVKYVPHPIENLEAKVFLSKKLGPHVLDLHRSARTRLEDSGR
ncbi:MAG: hypothetical protein ACR2LU_12370 [Luteitalea sp.]